MTMVRGEEQGDALARGRSAPAPPIRQLLRAWEDGRDASPGERGLILLRAAAPALAEEDRGNLSVGCRDAILLDLFERLFGAAATALATCPSCGEPLEFDVRLSEIRVLAPVDRPDRFTLTWAGREIAYRLPRARDLAAIGAENSTEAAAHSLAQRCILAIQGADGTQDSALTEDGMAALEAAIAAAVEKIDPQAVVTLAFECPSCALHWQSQFDIVDFLWQRLDVYVRGVLRQVHVIASHYGWSERQIVSLSPARRQHYLDLIGL